MIKITNTHQGVDVKYIINGKGRQVRAKMAYYAGQLGFAPNIIEGLDEKSPKQAQTMRNIQYSHYSVHGIETTSHPYRGAYDTWFRFPDYNLLTFTDMILGRWTELKGYMGATE